MRKGGWNEEGGERLEEEKWLLVNMFGDKSRQGKRMEEEKKGAGDEVGGEEEAGEEVGGGEDMLLEQVGEEEKRN